jgi:hypothetical protein
MMQPTAGSAAEPPFVQALGAVATSMRGRVIAGDNDLIGVVLYGTKHSSEPEFMNTCAFMRCRLTAASAARQPRRWSPD